MIARLLIKYFRKKFELHILKGRIIYDSKVLPLKFRKILNARKSSKIVNLPKL